MEAAFSNLGGLLSQVVGMENFDPTGFVPEPHGSLSTWSGAVATMQMHHHESRSPQVQRWKRRVHLWLFICQPQSLEPTRSGCCAPKLLMCKLFITVLASSSCLLPLQGVGTLSLGCSFHGLYLAST